MSRKIFISHSVQDKELIKNMEEVLILGMGVAREQIFCTSNSDSLETGTPYIEEIKKELKEAQIIIAVITESYLKSKSCVMELGAAWILSEEKKLFPMVVYPVTFDQIEDSLLRGYQMQEMNRAGLTKLYDKCVKQQIINQVDTEEFISRVEEFTKKVNTNILQNETDLILEPDVNGYFETEILSVRLVPDAFRCYEIKGKIQQDEPYFENESHWIFFRANQFEKLDVGDKIKFKVNKTEIKHFKDLSNARNIYLSDLRKM